jgi:ATP-dependent protease ClpP protease subunit
MEVMQTMRKFWNFNEMENGENVLRLDGEIASESWWGDEVTPKLFMSEFAKCDGNITVWINSPGGDVVAGSQIYTALKEHKGQVTVKIDGIAASAASVIAMTKDQFDREKNYRVSISIIKSLLSKGIISEKDYRKIDTKLAQKYCPVFGNL